MQIDGCEITNGLANFQVGRWQGREFLFHNGKKIAQCINGDHDTRFGGITGWLEHIYKRTEKRRAKIASQISELQNEEARLAIRSKDCVDARWTPPKKQADS